MEQNKKSGNIPTHIRTTDFEDIQKLFSEERIVFSINCAETTGFHMNKNFFNPYLTLYKNQFKM